MGILKRLLARWIFPAISMELGIVREELQISRERERDWQRLAFLYRAERDTLRAMNENKGQAA